MLDERLSLAAQLYEPCALGADIGTDHALLPCYLLTHNICQEMILADVSPKALLHAEESVRRHHLEKRAHVRLADGLDALTKPCGCVSMMGMGGETIRKVLLSGAEKLCGAVLVLSSHTEQPLVRRTLPEIGYHIVQEKLCQAAGRFYIFWRAEPGQADDWTAEEVHYGRLLWVQNPPKMLRTLLDAGLTPVFSAITCDGRGTLLNTNADSVASAVAVAASRIAPTQPVFCFEKAGVLRDVEDERSVIAEITPDTYAAPRAEGAISAGRLPKIDGALRAVASGVESVVIKQAEALLDAGGTMIRG